MMKASEMLAARKAAKKEQAVKKYARDNIGNQRADRNKLANIAVIQTQNKLSLRSGAPQDLDSKLTENIKNLMHYQALVYENDRSSITVFEKLIRAMCVVACIYSDNDLSKTTNDAQAAIEQLQESDDIAVQIGCHFEEIAEMQEALMRGTHLRNHIANYADKFKTKEQPPSERLNL